MVTRAARRPPHRDWRSAGRSKLSTVLIMTGTALAVVVGMNFTSGDKKIETRIEPIYAVTDPQFRRSMGTLLGPSLRGGNTVTALQNGDEIFPAMLDAIRAAERSICLETYIYWSGRIGREFADVLTERARAGVAVHVLLDWVGSGKMDQAMLDQMDAGGVHVQRFHPLRWYNLSRFNNRTHRKILVVDGKVGFTGGVGIADTWLGDAQDSLHWRDSHFRLRGPSVADMQSAFMDNWIETNGEVLHGDAYFPELASHGQADAQVFKSGPGEGSESMRLMFLLSIASARANIRIAASYFVPDDLSIETLVAARQRGVNIEILLPGEIMDAEVTRRASRSRWGDLLRAGIVIYEYQPTMYHCKVMIVDDVWVSVGSTNFDNRSFRLNDEANLNIYDRTFAGEQIAVFEADKRKARRFTLEMWETRPFKEKVIETLAGLIRSQL